MPLLGDEKENIRIKKYLPENLIAPVYINQNAGKIQFKVGNNVLGEVDICITYSIPKTNILEYYGIIFNTFLDFSKYIY